MDINHIQLIQKFMVCFFILSIDANFDGLLFKDHFCFYGNLLKDVFALFGLKIL
jgi:hypothetical protein